MSKQTKKIYALEFVQIKDDEKTVSSQTVFEKKEDVKPWIKDNIDNFYIEDLYFAKGLNSKPLFTINELKELDPTFNPKLIHGRRCEMREIEAENSILCQWELNEKEVVSL